MTEERIIEVDVKPGESKEVRVRIRAAQPDILNQLPDQNVLRRYRRFVRENSEGIRNLLAGEPGDEETTFLNDVAGVLPDLIKSLRGIRIRPEALVEVTADVLKSSQRWDPNQISLASDMASRLVEFISEVAQGLPRK